MTGQLIRTIAANPTDAGRTVDGATEVVVVVVVVRIVMVIAIIAELLALACSTFYCPQQTTGYWGVCCHGSGGACRIDAIGERGDAAEADDVMTNSDRDGVDVRTDQEQSLTRT